MARPRNLGCLQWRWHRRGWPHALNLAGRLMRQRLAGSRLWRPGCGDQEGTETGPSAAGAARWMVRRGATGSESPEKARTAAPQARRVLSSDGPSFALRAARMACASSGSGRPSAVASDACPGAGKPWRALAEGSAEGYGALCRATVRFRRHRDGDVARRLRHFLAGVISSRRPCQPPSSRVARPGGVMAQVRDMRQSVSSSARRSSPRNIPTGLDSCRMKVVLPPLCAVPSRGLETQILWRRARGEQDHAGLCRTGNSLSVRPGSWQAGGIASRSTPSAGLSQTCRRSVR
jgi:hypothetical protein